jgi:hypothetical protein
LEEQVAKCLSERFILDTAKGMHFCPRDVDAIPTAQNNDVGGLKLLLKVSPDNGGLSYEHTYTCEWII